MSPSLESPAFAQHRAPAADGGCLSVLLSCGPTVDMFTISMGTRYNRACVLAPMVARPPRCSIVANSLRSLTKVEVAKYLCHFFDFTGQADELARNVALVQGTKSQMRGRSCARQLTCTHTVQAALDLQQH